MTIDASAVARVLGIETKFEDLRDGGVLFLPQRIAVIAPGASDSVYPATPFQATSAFAAGQRCGFGSLIHLLMRELFPQNGDGVGSVPVTIYPLTDAVGAAPAAGAITPTGVQTLAASYRVKVAEVASAPFVISTTDTPADVVAAMTTAINAALEMPVIAADEAGVSVSLTCKWGGTSGNDLIAEVEGEDFGMTLAVTQPVGGLVNPDVDDALGLFGTVWESMVLNAFEVEDTVTLDKIQTVGEGRWGELVRKPFVAFCGNTAATVADATVICDARPLDRINAQLVAPGSNHLPGVVAARQLSRIARLANNNPPVDYGSQRATGLVPGPDAEQWTYPDRDQAVKAGCSTIEVKDGEISIGDVVTFYHPAGDPLPAFRHVVDIVKLQNILFNLDLVFKSGDWDGAVLIPDGQPTVNPLARKPSAAKAAGAAMVDSLGLHALISDPESAKASQIAAINSQNGKRLDYQLTVQLSGNVNIINATLRWGFFFGTPAVVG